jgi:hypothetical protein
MNPQVTQYINIAPAEQAAAMQAIRSLIHQTVPGVQEEFKWGRPVFRAKKDIAYFKTTKAYLTLGFFDRNAIKDPGKLLEGTGTGMCHIKIRKATEVPVAVLKEWFRDLQ